MAQPRQKKELAAHLPSNPAPLKSSTLIELQAHHVRPYLSKEDYLSRKKEPSPVK